MANFFLIADPDQTRRESVLSAASKEIAFLPHLTRGVHSGHDVSLTWAAAPRAPISRKITTDAACFVFGEPLSDEGSVLDAGLLSARYSVDFTRSSEGSGFYAALFLHRNKGVRVEADVLGIFPIYYWQSGSVLLVGSSPALFTLHPAFSATLNLHGAAALLLTSGLVGGQTLWQGVRRLEQDHVLVFNAATGVRELAPPSTPTVTAPAAFEECVDEVDRLQSTFLQASLNGSHAPGLLLSGGLDSRLLAGVVSDLGFQAQCITFGSEDDLDAQCATQVAQSLGLPQTLRNVDPAAYATYAAHTIRWEQLSGGFYAIPMGWNLAFSPQSPDVDRIVCGLTLDAVIGGPKEITSTGSEAPDYESLRMSSLGYGRDELKHLVSDRSLLQACDDTRETLVRHYLQAADQDHLRTWRTNLAFRHRFPVGACAWRYSFYAWPVLPALDRRLIRLAAALPLEVVAKRRLQRSMLTRRFPQLARLELDRNYFDTTPLVATRQGRGQDLARRFVKLGRRLKGWVGEDPRFYERVMSFNSSGWRSVRAASENARGGLAGLFDLQALAATLPGPGVRIDRRRAPLVPSTPLKNTVGLMSWLHQYQLSDSQ